MTLKNIDATENVAKQNQRKVYQGAVRKKRRMVGFEPVTWLSTVRWFDHWAMTALIQVMDAFSNLFERIDL